MAVAQANRVADFNDEFRRSGIGVVVTPGVQSLAEINGLLHEVRMFNSFTEDNDPHGEHDFGTIIWGKKKVFWKIDYYNESLDGWSDPASTECNRILTVMLAAEY